MTQQNKPLPSQDELNRIFTYNPENGELRYKIPRGTKQPGDLAGRIEVEPKSPNNPELEERRIIQLNGNRYYASRIIWLMVTGDDIGELEIDHKDVNPLNDRWSNLRLANNACQGWNRPKCYINTSGFKGVDFHKGYWRARIRFWPHGRFTLGETFKTKEEAGEAYAIAAEALHQEFANLN